MLRWANEAIITISLHVSMSETFSYTSEMHSELELLITALLRPNHNNWNLIWGNLSTWSYVIALIIRTTVHITWTGVSGFRATKSESQVWNSWGMVGARGKVGAWLRQVEKTWLLLSNSRCAFLLRQCRRKFSWLGFNFDQAKADLFLSTFLRCLNLMSSWSEKLFEFE